MLQIIYEDNYLLVLNKPSGLRAEGGHSEEPSLAFLVAKYLRQTYPWKKQLITGVVHRVDRPVSGLMLFAKTPMALKELNRQFENREPQKTYVAIVENQLPAEAGELAHWLKKDQEKRRADVAAEGAKGAQACKLRYKVLQKKTAKGLALCLVEIEMLTGRYHQIRAQLSAVGCPILGDEKYGSHQKNEVGMIHLHAHRLQVVHPKTSERIEFKAPFPSTPPWRSFRV